MKISISKYLLAISFLFCLNSYADISSEITFGLEITAGTNKNADLDTQKPVNGEVVNFSHKTALAFQKLTGGELIEKQSSIKDRAHKVVAVKTKIGTWKFHDDHGVIEAVSPVIRLHQLDEVQHIFTAFEKAGLRPHIAYGGQYGGGGHIHIGRNIFDQNPILLRNFLVDLLNRPFIRTALEEPGDLAALGIRERGLESLLRKRLAKLDERILKGKSITTKDVAEVYFEVFQPRWKTFAFKLLPKFIKELIIRNLNGRNSDVNLGNIIIDTIPTVEFRTPRPPTSLEILRRRLILMESYLTQLSQSNELIPFKEYTQEELRRFRLPSVATQEWNSFLSQIQLNPENYTLETLERFPVLTKAGAQTEQGYQLEIREGVTENQNRLFEVRVLCTDPLDQIQILQSKNKILSSSFSELSPGVWVANFEIPEKRFRETFEIYVMNRQLEVVQDISGTFRLWNGFFGALTVRPKFQEATQKKIENIEDRVEAVDDKLTCKALF